MQRNGMELLDPYIAVGSIGWLINGANGMAYGFVSVALTRLALAAYVEYRQK